MASSYFRALTCDYDGTLTEGGRPHDRVLAALQRLRERGLRVVLATGRILAELRQDFPDVDGFFDMIVGENGAVLARPGEPDRLLASPIDAGLIVALRARGVELREGQVLLALQARDAAIAVEEIARSGTEDLLVRNREALMVLPSGVSKGSGLFQALGELGVSFHNNVSVGDAENDHSLLAVSELGAAVGNAIPSLKEHADVVLEGRAGAGVEELADGPVLRGVTFVHPQRWRVALGSFLDGRPATLPASQINVLVTGGSGCGKSYLAGLLVERLTSLGYAVCVLDPEGDHEALGKLRGVAAVGSEGQPPPARELRGRLRGRFSSVVVGLTALKDDALRHYVREALVELSRERLESGLPHWIVVEEAQNVFLPGGESDLATLLEGQGGSLVSYQPERLPASALARLDAALLLPGLEPAQLAPLADAFGTRLEALDTTGIGPGEALLLQRAPPLVRPFRIGPRSRPHVRHWHKYLHAVLPPDRWFFFRQGDAPTGRSAQNLEEFHRQLEHVDLDVLRHHLAASDFSRWLRLSLHDDLLANWVAAIEASARRGGPAGEEERSRILAAIERRYGAAEEAA
ncbi:MAG TPA: HAD hydrolase family protein [Myxococcales bacterium]|nr:HAD hydrolase family protein [Myxococcales bacterium]